MDTYLASMTVPFTFEAAHYMEGDASVDTNARMHGHSFRCLVTIKGPVDAQTHMIMPFEQLNEKLQQLRKQLDHRLLNDVEGLENTSGECLAKWIYDQLKKDVVTLHKIVLDRPLVGISVEYSAEEMS